MKHLLLIATTTLSPLHHSTQPDNVEIAMACFKAGEETSGLNRICFYNCMGSKTAITIKITEICPITIEQ